MKKKILSIIALVLIFTLSFGSVALAADIQIGDAYLYSFSRVMRSGIYWTSPEIGYAFHQVGSYSIGYKKTLNGGETWGSLVTLTSTDASHWSAWADWETPGNSGTRIHFAMYDWPDKQIRYMYFDTANESYSSIVTVESF